jgi:methyl-accepting chemotaxis protein
MKNISLKAKLLLAFGMTAVFLLAVGMTGRYFNSKTVSLYQKVRNVNLQNIVSLADMRTRLRDAALALNRVSLNYGNAARIQEFKKTYDEAVDLYEKADKAYTAIPFGEGEDAMYRPVDADWEKMKTTGASLFQLSLTGKMETQSKYNDVLTDQFNPLLESAKEELLKLANYHKDAAAKAGDEAEAASELGAKIGIGVVVAGLILALTAGLLISTSLSKSLNLIAEKLGGGAEEVASASQQLSSTSEELAASNNEQAASLAETASSIEEMSAMVAKNADNANRSREISGESQQSATRGKQVVDDMIKAIGDINDANANIMSQIETSNREISEIVKVISEIGNKTKVINDIVFQTKLLSFNASVEAARAGEHGKGFAVVAEEVGNLAQMSGNAAKEISNMLDGSIQKVENIVNDTKTNVERLVAVGKQKVQSGTEVAHRCGDVLDEIVQSVSQVNTRVGEISTASQEQSQGVSEITKAVAQLDQVTQQNAAASQQAASASEELSAQADMLRIMVRELLIQVRGANAVPEHTAHKDSSKKAHGKQSSIREHHVAAEGEHGKVVTFNKGGAQKTSNSHAATKSNGAKKVVGFENEHIPSEDDPRFQDV